MAVVTLSNRSFYLCLGPALLTSDHYKRVGNLEAGCPAHPIIQLEAMHGNGIFFSIN